MVNDLELAAKLRPVLLKLARELRKELASLGVTGGQASLLASIKDAPGIGLRELAAQEGVSAPAMTRHVDRLERAGLVRRSAHGSDRRRVGLELTTEGRRVLRAVRSRRTAWLAARLKGLPPEQRAAIDAAIEPLQELMAA